MRRRVLLCLTLIAMSACNGDRIGQPIAPSTTPPTNDISDATHSAIGFASNPDFFFLPPMVKNPSGSPQWNAGAFNPSLTPTVEICASTATSEAAVATSPCTAMLPSFTATVDAGAEQYQVNWKVPSSSTIFYRLTVKVGSRALGFADVETGSNASQLKNVATGEFIPLLDGRTLPIKFRIERYALCSTPGVGPCTTASGDISVAPLTVSTGTPDPSGISTSVGVTIPQQSIVPAGTIVTVTIASCPNLNPAVLDIPTFGDCSRVTTDPVLPRLTSPATVFICSVGVTAPIFAGLSEDQERRVTLHRYDATGDHAGVVALPHATACTPGTPGGTIASVSPSVGSMLASLGHGQFRRAASQAVELLSPKPLYAASFIDLGGGGYTEFFSDFQFALPAKMEIVPATNNQVAPAGTTLSPTVKVTDLGGDAVHGAVVHFFSADPASAPGIAVTTGADGLATTPWIISAGTNTLPASGRGIAAPNRNGPRRPIEGEIDNLVDPFQPIQSFFDGAGVTPSGEISVLVGSVSFTATTPAVLLGSSAGRGTSVSDPNPGSLFTIDAATGQATLIGSTNINGGDGEPEVSAIRTDPITGTLYGIVGSACTGAQLITINPTTGAGTLVGILIGAGFDGTPVPRAQCRAGTDALAFASDGSLYASGWIEATRVGNLLKVDKLTGAVVAMFPTTGGIHMSGLAFDASGVLWASRGGNGRGQLVTVNPATGATTSTLLLKTPEGVLESLLVVSDLAFGRDGTLYASLPAENTLATINPITGVVTRIGTFGTGVMRMSGLAFR